MLPYHAAAWCTKEELQPHFTARSTPIPAYHCMGPPPSPAPTPPDALAHLLAVSYRVEVKYDQVAVGHVEARQVVARVLSVVNVLVHYIRSAAGLLRVATAADASNSDIA